MHELISLKTEARQQLLDVTAQVERALTRLGAGEGMCFLFVPHTTAAITINENADPSVPRDFLTHLDKLVPWQAGYTHAEGNSAAHIKAGLLGMSVAVPVSQGRPLLGMWQGIFLAEFDGPRQRRLVVSFQATTMPGEPSG